MSAATPFPTSGVTTADKRYEPSMEEILASIRRIIADDQTLPGKPPEPAPATNLHQPVAPPNAFIAPAAPQVEAVAPASDPATPVIDAATPVHELRAHGVVAAPQFVTPEGPATDPASSRELRQAPEPVHVPEPESQQVSEPEVSIVDVYSDEDEHLYETAIEPTPVGVPHAFQQDDAPEADEVDSERAHDEPPAALFSAATDTSLTSAFNMLAASRLADNSDELMNLAREMIRPLLRSWIDDNLPSMVERMVRAEIERVARGGR